MFELQDLRIVAAIAKHRGITKAARELGYVQPNVTARLNKLESYLGFPLFIRTKKEVILTPYGKVFYNYAKMILNLCHEAESAMNKLAIPDGELSIGAMETTSYVRLPHILKQYSANYPNVKIKLQTGTTKELIDKVLNNDIEGAFVAGPVNHPDLIEKVIFKERLVLITNTPNNPLKNKECTLVVFKEGCYYREVIIKIMDDYHITIKNVIEVDAAQAILHCVSEGLGISLIPESMSKLAKSLYTYPIYKDYVNVDTVLITRKSLAKTLAFTKFADLLTSKESTQLLQQG
ncbi:LysR family transcriptional regulator [Parageobacillus thermoglucosidasius]|uniref:LysR family transcriptional regulator n=1 Tax=Parageobacillus thermoglucosidasius TaxID=1426 RepID=A0AB38R505_PARTM|nr:LysR family transcriptional regulator [Parageobacillus thermoglucosidasius]UOE78293.1 LysR family transcriptional regulator [Parageobacillus thermoglucosidasius]BDG34074.1 LysR family transcriptional regulator [Parageobacillus thermoglucosidasius]